MKIGVRGIMRLLQVLAYYMFIMCAISVVGWLYLLLGASGNMWHRNHMLFYYIVSMGLFGSAGYYFWRIRREYS